ncbi:MAG: ABC transporter ATP-binding protein, partial [Bdellovibrionales bacterium]|nr:ABC transporter ATP-binding protein [Bdellovibrionales bacterium]
ELFHKFHLAPYRNTLVETLSGGWARRVEIAKALLHDPSLILMDEPSSGLDPKARIELWNILSTLKDEGKTIVLTTHHLDEADHCDELIVMYEGKIVAKGTPNLLKHRLKMKVVFLKSSQSTEIETFLTKEKDVKISRHRHLLRIEMPENSQLITTLMESYKGKIDELSYRSPNLEDVFIHFTGSEFEVGASL